MRKISIILIPYLFLISCDLKPVTLAELKDYVQNPNNGLTQSIQLGQVELSVQYKPSELMAAVDIIRSKALASDSIIQYYKQFTYLLISIGSDNVYVDAILNQKIQDFTSKIDQSVNFNNQSLIDYHVIDNYAIAGSTDILLVYNYIKEKENLELDIDTSVLGYGVQSFIFFGKQIENIPPLII
ncbi:MAG TPA: hypothetical protein PKL31_15860 [Fulvivirga sp.]|nr:hypothetical protein [Fulvivirga sp.]